MFSFPTVSKRYLLSRINRVKNSEVDNKIDGNSIEASVYALFKIDLLRIIKNEVSLAKNFNIQPSELERKPYWEYEYFIDAVNNNIEEENKRQEEEHGDYNKYNPSKLMRDAKHNMPKMPNMNNITMPKMPKL